jgi:glyoxylase-like metal-dependent hydrolase (beta-lactamase superfamily II)
MTDRLIAPGLWALDGAVQTGMLVSGDHALLVDCCDTVTPERLAALGVRSVDIIMCTQHRRPNVAGAYPFVKLGALVMAAEADRPLLEQAEARWADPANRWHVYDHQPGPQTPTRSLPVARGLLDGERIVWGGWDIQVLDTPGATDHSVSYLVRGHGTTVCFCGDAIYGPGQLWDIASLQKGFGCVGDYHGYIGNAQKLIPSLQRLADSGAELLVPSHGAPIAHPREATSLLAERLHALWRSAAAISSLNHYFPDLYADLAADPARMPPAETREPPPFVHYVDATSYSVVSDSGALLLIDCGRDCVIDRLRELLVARRISAVDGCWVTHYHDDHTDALEAFQKTFGAPVITDQHMADVLEHPERYSLPCISPKRAQGVRATREAETWRWHEFMLTAWHFPGQTYYHSGLLVEGYGTSVFFAGDSGSPTGIDDHCCPNRCFLGEGRGFRRCIELWRQLRPDYTFNEHQLKAFRFTASQLDYMEHMLTERERLLGSMLPWSHPDFGCDEGWARTYPYEQTVRPGQPFWLDVQLTNHGPEEASAAVEPVLPADWVWDAERSVRALRVPARTDGCVDAYATRPDGAARLWLCAPQDASAGLYVLPVRLTWDGCYLGQFRQALVHVANDGGE